VMLAGAIEPAARLAIMNALSDLAAEVTGALRDTTVELKLDGRDVRVSVTEHVACGTVTSRPWTGFARMYFCLSFICSICRQPTIVIGPPSSAVSVVPCARAVRGATTEMPHVNNPAMRT